MVLYQFNSLIKPTPAFHWGSHEPSIPFSFFLMELMIPSGVKIISLNFHPLIQSIKSHCIGYGRGHLMKKTNSVVLAVIILVLAAMSAAHAEYSYTPLNYPDASVTEAYGINSAGIIVGRYSDGSGLTHGFSLIGTTYTPLDYPGALDTYAYGINSYGTIVGRSLNLGAYHGFSLTGTTYTPVDYPGATDTTAYGINSTGTIVGNFEYATGYEHGFSLSGTTYTLVYIPESDLTLAYGINDGGTIVGNYNDGSKTYGISLSGTTYTLIDYPGATATSARAINNEGTIVGYYWNGTTYHGFSLSDYTFTPIDYPGATSTWAYGINSYGMIVGKYKDGTGATRGFVAYPTPFAIPGDFVPADCDVDGSDLAIVITNPSLMDLATLAQNFGKTSEGCSCTPGTTRPCYTGPAGTVGVGVCRTGTKTCNAEGTAYGPCQGDVVPTAEVCDALDNDCDGLTDEDVLCGAYRCVWGTCPDSCYDQTVCSPGYSCDYNLFVCVPD